MECATIKEGTECTFMAKAGCTYTGGRCLAVVEQCGSCGNVKEYPSGSYCGIFASPESKWAFGRCSFATHMREAVRKEEKKLNPLKASKRAQKKK